MSDEVASYKVTGDADGATMAFRDVGAAVETTTKKVESLETKLERMARAFEKAVNGGDEAAKSQERVANQTEKLARSVSKATGDIDKHGQKMGWLSSEWGKLGKEMEIAKGVWIANAGQAMLGVLRDSITASYEFSTKIKDLSDSFGSSTDDMQIFDAWASQTGTSIESMAGAIGKLQAGMAKGGKELKQYGITAVDAKEAFLQVVAAIERAPSQLEKARIANAAFGRSWKDIMPALKEGADGLAAIAANTSLIDSKTIDELARMDDEIASMATNARSLAAGLLAAFGPVTSEALAYWSGKLKDFNDWKNQESETDFYKRIGAFRQEGRASTIKVNADRVKLDELSSADVYRLMQLKQANGNKSVQWDDPNRLSLSTRLGAAKTREAAQAEEDRKKAVQEAKDAQDALNLLNGDSTKSAKEPDLTPDYMGLSSQIWLSDQAAAGNRFSPDTPEQAARDRRRLGWNSQGDHSTMPGGWGQAGRKEDFYGNDRARLAKQMQDAGLIGENGIGVYDATQMSIEEMTVALNNYNEAVNQSADLTEEQAAVMAEAYRGAAEAVAGAFGGAVSASFLQAIKHSENFGEALLDNVGEAFTQLTAKALAFGTEWLAIQALTGGPGSGVALGGIAGAVQSLFAHADGTASSPGGVGSLSERGMELVRTRQGFEGYATPGIYAMSPGAEVIPAHQVQAPSVQHLNFYVSGVDPAQLAEQMRRIAREEAAGASGANSPNHRTRNTGLRY